MINFIKAGIYYKMANFHFGLKRYYFKKYVHHSNKCVQYTSDGLESLTRARNK